MGFLYLKCILFQIFQQFDSDGDGTADIEGMYESVNSLAEPTTTAEMIYAIKALQSCSLAPG